MDKQSPIDKLKTIVNSELPENNEIAVLIIRLRRFARWSILNTLLEENLDQNLTEYFSKKHIEEEKSIREITSDINNDVDQFLSLKKSKIDKIILSTRNMMIDLFSDMPNVSEDRIDSAIYGSKRIKIEDRFDFLVNEHRYSITEIHRNAISNIIKILEIPTRSYQERHTSRYKELRKEGYRKKREDINPDTQIENIFINSRSIKGFLQMPNGKKVKIHPSEIVILLLMKEKGGYKNAEELFNDFNAKCESLKENGINIDRTNDIKSIYKFVSRVRIYLSNSNTQIPKRDYNLIEKK